MSITDELRAYATNDSLHYCSDYLAIADRIDEAHKMESREQYYKGYSAGYDAGYAVGFASADDWLADNEAEMSEHGWVKLPTDSDGVPIRLGDKVSEPEEAPNGGTVVGMKRYKGWDHWLINCGAWVDPRKCHHIHEPTVEDVLWEMLDEAKCKLHKDGSCEMGLTKEQIAKYAAKLRLADDGEES